MVELTKKYENALASLNYKPDADGVLGFTFTSTEGPQHIPASIDEKCLVLPESRFMSGDAMKTRVVFHPLSEDVMCAESEVLQFFRRAMSIRFNATFASLFLWMVETANDPKANKKFSPKQKKFFEILVDCSKNTVETATKLVREWLKRDSDYTLSKIYLRRTGAVFEGKKVTRSANITFPFMDELAIETKGKEVFWCGVKISKKDLHMLRNLANYLIPESISQEPECYNSGSIDPQAPYFDCLIRSFEKMMTPLNTVITLLGERYDGAENGYCDVSWVAEFNPISEWRNKIPSLDYNRGVPLTKNPPPTSAVPKAAAAESTKVSVNDLLSSQVPTVEAAPETKQGIDALLERSLKANVQPTSRWGDAPGSKVESTGGLNGLFNRVGASTGQPVNGWGTPAAPAYQVPQVAGNGIRSRMNDATNDALSAWSGRGNSVWA